MTVNKMAPTVYETETCGCEEDYNFTEIPMGWRVSLGQLKVSLPRGREDFCPSASSSDEG